MYEDQAHTCVNKVVVLGQIRQGWGGGLGEFKTYNLACSQICEQGSGLRWHSHTMRAWGVDMTLVTWQQV